MTEPLLHLRRSENGHFVLIEPVSQTVVVAEELGEAHARMCATLREAPPDAAPAPESRALFERRGRVRAAVIVAALLVPIAWVGWIAVEVRQANVTRAPRETRSQGHATRVAPTPSAYADRAGTDEDAEVDDEPSPKAAEVVDPAPMPSR